MRQPAFMETRKLIEGDSPRPYYWRSKAKYGNFEVQEHVLAGSFRVHHLTTGEAYRSYSEQQAQQTARTLEIAEKSGVAYSHLLQGLR
jgi:hypothetical protein